MRETTPDALLQIKSPPMADFFETILGMEPHVLIRFGMWEEILKLELPEDTETYIMCTAFIEYARGLAYSALGHIEEADAQLDTFLAVKARVPESRLLHNVRGVDLLEVAAAMLEGELAYRKGDHDLAFAHLRRAVSLDDALPYDEPWGWMQPTRHALGALLLEQGQAEEAEAVYRADLGLDQSLSRACQHPNNLWSLHGLHECLTRRGETTEALLIKQALDQAMARSEVEVKASCYCRQNAAA
jgi:tetratricopeptide (TPR) repeat protein